MKSSLGNGIRVRRFCRGLVVLFLGFSLGCEPFIPRDTTAIGTLPTDGEGSATGADPGSAASVNLSAYSFTLAAQSGQPLVIPVFPSGLSVNTPGQSALVVSAPGHGTAVANGLTLTYTPRVDFTGADGFSYALTDGNRVSASATVWVYVSSHPAASSAFLTLASGAGLAGDAPASATIKLSMSGAQGDVTYESGVCGSGWSLSGDTLSYHPTHVSWGLIESCEFMAHDSSGYSFGSVHVKLVPKTPLALSFQALEGRPIGAILPVAFDNAARPVPVVFDSLPTKGKLTLFPSPQPITSTGIAFDGGMLSRLDYAPSDWGNDGFTFHYAGETSSGSIAFRVTPSPPTDAIAPAIAVDASQNAIASVVLQLPGRLADGSSLLYHFEERSGASGIIDGVPDPYQLYDVLGNPYLTYGDPFTVAGDEVQVTYAANVLQMGPPYGGEIDEAIGYLVTDEYGNSWHGSISARIHLPTSLTAPNVYFPLPSADAGINGVGLPSFVLEGPGSGASTSSERYQIVLAPAHGTLHGSVYTPEPGFHGVDTFQYRGWLTGSTSPSAIGTFSIKVP